MTNKPDLPLSDIRAALHDAEDEVALGDAVHAAPPGTKRRALAPCRPYNVLRQKANVNNPQHVFHPRQLLDLMYFTGNDAVLHAMAEHMGRVVLNASPDDSDGNLHLALAKLQGHYAEVVRHTADLLAGMEAAPACSLSSNDVRRVQFHVQEVHAALGHLLGCMRVNLRPAPRVE